VNKKKLLLVPFGKEVAFSPGPRVNALNGQIPKAILSNLLMSENFNKFVYRIDFCMRGSGLKYIRTLEFIIKKVLPNKKGVNFNYPLI